MKAILIVYAIQFISMAVCLLFNEDIIVLGISLSIYGVSNYIEGKLSMKKYINKN